MKVFLLIALVFFQSSSSAVGGISEESVQEEKTSLEAVFARIEKAVSGLRRVSGIFEQERRTALMKDVLFSRGRFYFEPPDRMLWEAREPTVSGFALDEGRAVRWRGKRSDHERFNPGDLPALKAFARQVFAWMRADFEGLERRYRISLLEDRPATMELVPLSGHEARFLERIIVMFSSDDSHVSRVEIFEKTGDSTRIHFTEANLNPPARKDLF